MIPSFDRDAVTYIVRENPWYAGVKIPGVQVCVIVSASQGTTA